MRRDPAAAGRSPRIALQTFSGGRIENLIKLHETQLASDRTICREPLANQVRLILHTAAYWLLLTVRDAIPSPQPLATAEFTTLQMRIIKIGARITEAARRAPTAFAAACPEAALSSGLVRSLPPAGPQPRDGPPRPARNSHQHCRATEYDGLEHFPTAVNRWGIPESAWL